MANRNGQEHPGKLWIAIRFGFQHRRISKHHVENYIYRLRGFLWDSGCNLNNNPTVDFINSDNVIETTRALEKLKNERSKYGLDAIVFFIDDHSPPTRELIIEKFKDDVYVFETTGDELEDMLTKNDYNEAKNWCNEFVQQFLNVPSTSSPNAENQGAEYLSGGYNKGNEVDHDVYYNADVYNSSHNQHRNDQFVPDAARSLPGNSRDVLNSTSSYHLSDKMPQYNIPQNHDVKKSRPSENVEDLVTIEAIVAALEDFEKAAEDAQADFIELISGPRLYNRFSLPFPSLEENEYLLKLLVKTLEAAVTNKNCNKANDLLLEIADRGLLLKIAMQSDLYNFYSLLRIMYLMGRIFLHAFDVMPHENRSCFAESWNKFLSLLIGVPDNSWEKYAEEKDWFQKCVSKIQGKSALAKPSQIVPEEEIEKVEEIFYDASSENFIHPYIGSEANDPPEDFRTMSRFPTKRELLDPKPTYLRRSIIEGPYKDAQHYLDIQFRLFREDLVSPLRDGLHNHRRTGTTRYNRNPQISNVVIDDMPISDIVMFDVEQTDSFLASVADRQLKYGQLIVLSSDGFEADIHIGVIAERNDNDLLSKGSLGINFISEAGLELQKGYVLAEAASYLESYVHVLKVMQTINAFAPITMERYLVQTKTNRRRPRYLRQLDSDDNKEDEELENKYLELFKTECDRKHDENDKTSRTAVSIPSSKRRIIFTSEDNKKFLKFRGKLYNIDTLDEEFVIEDYDISQKKALVSALTSEFAIIQGPPGTGKTFIGVEIVRTILENSIRFGLTQPILVVCYSNAALDQFLEKIIDKVVADVEEKRYTHFGPIAVRLGTKSASIILERAQVMKKDVVAAYKSEFASEEDREVSARSKQKRFAAAALATASYIVSQEAQTEILAFQAYKDIIPLPAQNEMNLWCLGKLDSKQEKLVMDEVMACWLLNKSLETVVGVVLPPIDEDDEGELKKQKPRPVVDDEEDDIPLEGLFEQMNRIANEHQARLNELWNSRDDFDKKYETVETWDILKQDPSVTKKVKIFGGGGHKKVNFMRTTREVPYDQEIMKDLFESKGNILRATPLSEREVKDIRSIYDLPKQRRWQLFNYWNMQLKTVVKKQIPNLMKNYQTECDKMQKAYKEMDAAILSKSLLIGATTTGVAKFRKLLEEIGCRILVIEEAAEVIEAHTLSSLLPSIEHAILIGDHQQLRPNPAVYELGRTYNMEVSLFERLIKNGIPFDTLEKQHRMHPDITASIVRPHFYKMIKDADEVKVYPEVIGMNRRLFFWTHKEAESSGIDGVSFSNLQEIEMVAALLEHLQKQGYCNGDITVIATYSAQVEALRDKIKSKFGSNLENTGPAIAVETVDSFQGKENKIIIVSLVRSGGPTIGFLQIANRICVALTRAQRGMYIVGNADHLSSKSTLWSEIKLSLEPNSVGSDLPIKCAPHGTIQYIQNPNEFAQKSPDGGCLKVCGYPLDCGHSCPRKCHRIDDHSSYLCKEPCTKSCKNKNFSHRCQKRCFEDCGLCPLVEPVKLSCGHVTNVACHCAGRAQCVESCEKLLVCGHQCQETCGRPCKTYCETKIVFTFKTCGHSLITPCHTRKEALLCKSTCDEILSCGHTCQEKCGEICTLKCQNQVERTLVCGHINVMSCSQDPLATLCRYPVYRTLSCGHECDVPCYANDDRKYCTISCFIVLPCGHLCEGKCGECYSNGKHICPETCQKYLSCGHKCSKRKEKICTKVYEIFRCGEKCGGCTEDCLNSCSHICCGSKNMKLRAVDDYGVFNRSCDQQCVLCPKPCDNRCDHRACSRRCYEVCDVAVCDQSCSKVLKCSHACLGICGEICPDLCGTCSKNSYKSLLLRNDLTDSAFHHLIQIPLCTHIIPVPVLDDHVTHLKDSKTFPNCPKCLGSLCGINRYAKILKKAAMDGYNVKENLRNKAVPPHSADLERRKAKNSYDELELSILKGPKNNRGVIIEKIPSLEALVVNITKDIETKFAQGSSEYALMKDLSRCLQSLCKMYSETISFSKKFGNTLTGPPNLYEWSNRLIFRGQIFNETKKALEVCRSNLELSHSLQLSGAIVPQFRYLLCRVLYHLTIWEFVYLYPKADRNHPSQIREQRDLTNNQVKELRNVLLNFTQGPYGGDYYSHYLRFLQHLNEKLLTNGFQIQIAVELPEF